MDIQLLKQFLMWCCIINGGLLLFWALCCKFMPDKVYQTQKAWIAITQDQFNLVMYCFLAVFKIFIIVFNLVPLIALLILT